MTFCLVVRFLFFRFLEIWIFHNLVMPTESTWYNWCLSFIILCKSEQKWCKALPPHYLLLSMHCHLHNTIWSCAPSNDLLSCSMPLVLFIFLEIWIFLNQVIPTESTRLWYECYLSFIICKSVQKWCKDLPPHYLLLLLHCHLQRWNFESMQSVYEMCTGRCSSVL